MQSRTTNRFDVLETAIGAIEVLRAVVGKIERQDRDLGDQVGRALAAGSASEARTALRVAVAWGYVEGGDIEAGDEMLHRVGAMLYRLRGVH